MAVVTVSDTRTRKTDANAAFLSSAIEQSGNRLHSIRIVKDEPDQVRGALRELVGNQAVQVILFNGEPASLGATGPTTCWLGRSKRN